MNLRILIFFSLISAFLGCASSPRPSSSSDSKIEEMGIRFPLVSKKLSNGLKVLVVEDRTVPVVSYQTWVHVGSVDEPFGLTGMAHLFEHLMFKDSARFGSRAFFRHLESKGASVNAFTTRDYTVFHETFVPELLPIAIELESDRLGQLKLDPLSLYTEKQVVSEERRMRSENSPEGRMHEAVWSLVFKSHPYRWPVIGYEEDLRRMEVEDLAKFFSEHYHPGNVTIVVVGAVNAPEVFRLVEKNYGSIPGRARKKRKTHVEPVQTEARELTLYDEVATPRVTLAYPSTEAANPDTHALDVLAGILFSGNASRAYRRLVEELKIALHVEGLNYTPLFPGIFMAGGTLRSGVPAQELEKEIEKLFQEVKIHGVTDEEISIAVRQLMMQTLDSLRSAHGLANLVGTVDAVLGDPLRFRDDLSSYLKVTREDVIRVARQYLVPQRKNVVRLLPGKRTQ